MKREIREDCLRKRDRIPEPVRSVKSRMIKENIFSLPEYISSQTVLLYASFRSEVDTSGLIKEAIESGKKVLLPKVDRENRRLLLYEIKDISELAPGFRGILEPSPTEERAVSPEDIDLVVIPGAGYDDAGNRLGYGGGYYDRLLSQTEKKLFVIAPAFEEQMADMIPAEEHDVKVDIIVTDRRIIRLYA